MKGHTYQMTLLFDFYGDLLTERQKECFDLYYNEDYSLAEIAEQCGISRQGVRDAIVRAEHFLAELEEKAGVVARFQQMSVHLNEIERAAEELALLNRRSYGDQQISDLTQRIQSAVKALKE